MRQPQRNLRMEENAFRRFKAFCALEGVQHGEGIRVLLEFRKMLEERWAVEALAKASTPREVRELLAGIADQAKIGDEDEDAEWTAEPPPEWLRQREHGGGGDA